MKKLMFLAVISFILATTTLSSYACWAYMAPEDLIKEVDVVVDATVIFPEGSTSDHIKTVYYDKDFEKYTDFTYPVTLSIHKIIKNNHVLTKKQKEINLLIDNSNMMSFNDGKILISSTHIDFLFFEGERAIFLLNLNDKKELEPIHYPTYKLQKDDKGKYVEEDCFMSIEDFYARIGANSNKETDKETDLENEGE